MILKFYIRLIAYVITNASKSGKYEAGFTDGSYRLRNFTQLLFTDSHIYLITLRSDDFIHPPSLVSDFSAQYAIVGETRYLITSVRKIDPRKMYVDVSHSAGFSKFSREMVIAAL